MITVNNREAFLRALKDFIPVNPVVAELGVYQGAFSQKILSINRPYYLALIDPYQISETKYSEALGSLPTAYSTEDDYQCVLKQFHDEGILGQVNVFRLHSYEAVKLFKDGYFDCIYIDASHLYPDIKKDLNDWLPKLKEGGVMAGHDYVNIDGFGVIQAVNEFMEEHNFEMVIFNKEGGDWALKRK